MNENKEFSVAGNKRRAAAAVASAFFSFSTDSSFSVARNNGGVLNLDKQKYSLSGSSKFEEEMREELCTSPLAAAPNL